MAFPDRMARLAVASLLAGIVPLVASPPAANAASQGDTDRVVREDGNFNETFRKSVEVNAGAGTLEQVHYVKLWRKWSERPVRYEQTGIETVLRERLVPVVENETVSVPDWVVQEQWLPRFEKATAQGTRSITVPLMKASRRWVSIEEARALGAGLPGAAQSESEREALIWRWTTRQEQVDVPRFAWVSGAWLTSSVDTLVMPDLVWATKSIPVWRMGYWEKEVVVQDRQIPVLATVSVKVNPSEVHDHDEDVPRIVEADEVTGRVLLEEQHPVTDTVEELGYENKFVKQLVLRADGTYDLEDRMMPVASTRSVQVPRMVTREVPTKQDVDQQVWDRVRVTVPGSRTEVISRETRMATESYELTLPRYEWVPTGDWVSHVDLVKIVRNVVGSVNLTSVQGGNASSSSGRTAVFGSTKLEGAGKAVISGSAAREAMGATEGLVSTAASARGGRSGVFKFKNKNSSGNRHHGSGRNRQSQ